MMLLQANCMSFRGVVMKNTIMAPTTERDLWCSIPGHASATGAGIQAKETHSYRI